MCNIIGYLQEHGQETFRERVFGATDALILSQLSYINWSGIVKERKEPETGCYLKEILQMGKERQIIKGSFFGPQNLSLFTLCASSRRFGNVRIFAYKECCKKNISMQFSAVSFQLASDVICVVFRGTDESVTGWQENFSMVYRFPVPAQKMAVRYLEEVAGTASARIVVTGHSKGGNLAVYASAKCSPFVQKKLQIVYNFDGPGFWEEFLAEESYRRIAGRIRKYVVPESLVGLLLKNEGRTYMVESDAHGMMQHDPYRWQIADCKLKRAQHYNSEKRLRGELLNERILQLPKEDARKLIDSFFDAIKTRGVVTVTKLKADDTLVVLKHFIEENGYNKEAVAVLGDLVLCFIPSPHFAKTHY